MNDGQALKEYLSINNVDISHLASRLNKSRAMIYTHLTKPSLKDSVKEMYIKHFGVNFFIDTNKKVSGLSQESNIAYKAIVNQGETNGNQSMLNDINPVNSKLTHMENSTFPERSNEVALDITKWVDPNHLPIPVYDLAEGITSISELLLNDAFKPTVILLKGHLGCNAVVRHVDKAMNKDFPPRCQLGVQRLFDFKKRIVPGMAAIVVLNELTVTRYVYDAENKDEFVLKSSEAEKFPDMVVEKDEVKEMWKIKSLTPLPDIVLF